MLAAVIGVLAVVHLNRWPGGDGEPSAAPQPIHALDGSEVDAAYRAHRSRVEVEVTGVVVRRLGDDTDGSRHERFILRAGNLTVLVAHNVDLAPPVPLSPGDTVRVRGEYEWNQLGGVIHWTHHDPAGRHPPGWIRLRGRQYE